MVTLKQLKNVQTYDDLDALGVGRIICDISHRGGHIGFFGLSISEKFKINPNHLPYKFGAFCNYLGGGIRGSITGSGFSPLVTGRKEKLLTALAETCVRVYQNIEDESGLNETEDDDGETVWDAVATNAVRKSGIVSAY
jgi:hypothetical protein